MISYIEKLKVETFDVDDQVFYLKMKGDFYRYYLDIAQLDVQKNIEEAHDNYIKALDLSEKLETYNPTRLGLILNLSVLYYENKLEPGKGITLLKNTINTVMSDIDKISDKEFKEVSTLLQYMRDNLTLWTIDYSTYQP